MKSHISRIVRIYHLVCAAGWGRTGLSSLVIRFMWPFTERSHDISTQISPLAAVKQRIESKLCLLVHQTINGRAPAYLKDLIETTASVAYLAELRTALPATMALLPGGRD